MLGLLHGVPELLGISDIFELVRALFRWPHADDTRAKPCESPASFEFQLFVAVLDSLAPSLDSERNALEDPALMYATPTSLRRLGLYQLLPP